jgi:hypothetical protein
MKVAETNVQVFFEFLEVFVFFEEALGPEHVNLLIHVLHDLLKLDVMAVHSRVGKIADRKIINKNFLKNNI